MKSDVDSILLANFYFTKCKIEDPMGDETELARKYLVTKIKKTLSERSKKNESDKVLF